MGNDERHVGISANEGVGPAAGPLVEVRGISKHFGGVRAQQDVSIAFGRGTVHGLVGENGAGKSTLVKTIRDLELAGQAQDGEGGQQRHGPPVPTPEIRHQEVN